MNAEEAASPVANQRMQGLLFGDPLRYLDGNTGYRGPIACRAAGITYRQLDYWPALAWLNPQFVVPKVQAVNACILSVTSWYLK